MTQRGMTDGTARAVVNAAGLVTSLTWGYARWRNSHAVQSRLLISTQRLLVHSLDALQSGADVSAGHFCACSSSLVAHAQCRERKRDDYHGKRESSAERRARIASWNKDIGRDAQPASRPGPPPGPPGGPGGHPPSGYYPPGGQAPPSHY